MSKTILLLIAAIVMWLGISLMVGYAAAKKIDKKFWMTFAVTFLVQVLVSAMVFMLMSKRS